MEKHELKDLYQRFMRSNTRYRLYFGSINFPIIIEKFRDIESHERPDGLILLDDTVYMVEHFQVSPYLTEQGTDQLQRALNSNNTQKIGDEVYLIGNDDNWEDNLLNNWLYAFSASLAKHIKQYQNYIEETQKRYPNKPHKFLIVVEDNSNSVVTNEDLCILDILEFVEEILSYPQIDGVITFKTSTRGNSVVAKDRIQLDADQKNGKLRRIACCDFLMLAEKICGIQGLTVEQRKAMRDALIRHMGNLKEAITVEDSIQIVKTVPASNNIRLD